MKILLITNLCSPYRVGLFELLGRVYQNIRFIFFTTGQEHYYDGKKTIGNFKGEYVWGFNLFPKVSINPKLFSILAFGDYTHVIKCLNGPFQVLISFFLAKLRKKKFILWTGLWQHPKTPFHRLSFPFVNFLYRRSDAIVAYGTHVKKYLVSLGVPENKISIAWQTQENSKYNKTVSSEEINAHRTRLGVSTPYVIIFVGRLVEDKGIKILLEAFDSLKQSNTSLILVGKGPLENEIKEFSLKTKNIFHVGYESAKNLYKFYALADILVLPSITTKTFKEPWGFVVNEAMCQSCAIITSDAVGAGVGGLVQIGENGYIVPEKNSKALAQSLEKLLNNETLLRQMQKKSKELIEEWTYEKMASGFSEAIQIADKKSLF